MQNLKAHDPTILYCQLCQKSLGKISPPVACKITATCHDCETKPKEPVGESRILFVAGGRRGK